MSRLVTYVVIAATVIVSVAIAFVVIRKRKNLIEED